MKKDKTISPSEVNRYLFCNYQWYYQRKYGVAELRRLKLEKMEEMGIKPEISGDTFLQRGLRFHARFGRWRRLKLVLRLALALAIGLALAYFLLWR